MFVTFLRCILRRSRWMSVPAVLLAMMVVGLALATSSSAAPASVSMAAGWFNPQTVTVAVGETVTWVNDDTVGHVVVTTSAVTTNTFYSGVVAVGASFSWTPTTPGTYPYYCTIHPGMNGTAVVESGGGGGTTATVSPTATPTAGATPTSTPTVTPTAVPTATPTSAPPPAGSVSATMVDNAFTPVNLSVAAGTTVVWTNTGARPHTVTANDRSFDSRYIDEGGGTWSHTFSVPGTYSFVCTYHSGMTGSITVTGSGGSTPTATPTPGATATPTATPTSAPPPAGSVSATMVDNAFTPVNLSVAAGTMVVWTNTGARPHTVTADDGSFDSRKIVPNAGTWRHTFNVPGTYSFVCTYHAKMTGSITVTGAGGSAPPAAPRTPTPTPVPPPPAAPGSVNITDFLFSPKDLSVAVGATVTWRQFDRAPHTATSTDRTTFDSGNLSTGDAYSFTFRSAGTYQYLCTYHPEMVGSITVTNTPGAVGSWPAVPGIPNNILYNEVWDRTTGTYVAVPVSSMAEITTGHYTFWALILQGVEGGSITASGLPPLVIAFVDDHYSRFGGPPATFRVAKPAPIPTQPAAAPGPKPAGGPAEVSMIDFDYDPGNISVAVGTTVTFTNDGKAPHTATARDNSFDSGMMFKGDVYRHSFTTPGTFLYFCILHPQMIATVEVRGEGNEPPPPPAPIPAGAPAARPAPAVTTAPGDLQVVDSIFLPGRMSVKAGASLRWVSTGILPHTVTARDGSFDSGFMSTGDAFTRTFSVPGTYEYFCVIHPDMIGVVQATDAAGVAPPPAPALVSSALPVVSSGTAPGGAAGVAMVDFTYEPLTLTVKPGTEVIWRNTGVAPHTVTANDGSFDSSLVKRGDSFSHKFETIGTYEYLCSYHPAMVGKVVVSAAAAATSGPAAKVPPQAAAKGPLVELPSKVAVSAPGGGNTLITTLAVVMTLVVLVTAVSVGVVVRESGRKARA